MLAWLALLSLPFENQASEMKYVLSLLLLIPLVSNAHRTRNRPVPPLPLFAVRASTVSSISGLVTGM